MKQLLNSIYTVIKQEVPAIKFIDEDHGQIDTYDTRPSVVFPAALISINFNYNKQGGEVYTRTGMITARIAYNPIGERTDASNMQQVINESLSRLDIADAVRDTLTGWEPEGYGKFYLVSYTPERRLDRIDVKLIQFSFTDTVEI